MRFYVIFILQLIYNYVTPVFYASRYPWLPITPFEFLSFRSQAEYLDLTMGIKFLTSKDQIFKRQILNYNFLMKSSIEQLMSY